MSEPPRSAPDVSPIVALAVDLDRTLAPPGGDPTPTAWTALGEARGMGLKVIIASGREYSDLTRSIPTGSEVDALVAENGAVIDPLGAGPVRNVGEATGARIRDALRDSGPVPVVFGRVIASVPRAAGTWVAERVGQLPVELVPNVDRMTVLPAGVSKSSGVAMALEALGLANRPYAAIGDGENDVPMLRGAALSGAVANAAVETKAFAGYVCRSSMADGVAEFVRGPLAQRLSWPVRTAPTVEIRASSGP